MNIVRILFGLIVSWASVTAFAADDLSVFIDYRHGSVHVHYPLPCSYGSTSTLTSLADAVVPWRVEVTPKNLGHGLIAVTTVVRENGEEVSRSEIINKMGEKAIITSTDSEGDKIELTVHPK